MNKDNFTNFYGKIYDEIKKGEDKKGLNGIDFVIPLENDYFKNYILEAWKRELNYLISETNFCLNYAEAFNTILKEKQENLAEVQRNIYIKYVLNNLYSFKDKILYLFYELFDLKLKMYGYNKLNQERLEEKIKSYKNETYYDCLNKLVSSLDTIYKNNIDVFNYRNTNTHRWNIGIDTLGAGIFKRYYTDINTKERLLKNKPVFKDKSIEKLYDLLERVEGPMCTITPTNDNISFDNLINKIYKLIDDYNDLIYLINNIDKENI